MADPMSNSPLSRVPLAVFPSLFGLVGLAVAWLQAGPSLGIGTSLGWLVLVAAGGSFAVLTGLWVSQTFTNLAALKAALRSVPGRQGLATLILTAMLLAAALASVVPGLAWILVVIAMVCHLVLAIYVGFDMLRIGDLTRQVTPVWHLLFVGFIVGAQATAKLQMSGLTLTIIAVTFVAALGVYGLSAEQMREQGVAPEQRPLLMIHLAPISLFGSAAILINLPGTGAILGGLGCILAGLLLVRLRWIMAAGFSPFWAAFGFPVAAFTNLMLMLGAQFTAFWWIGLICLDSISIYIPLIFSRILGLWRANKLAMPPISADPG